MILNDYKCPIHGEFECSHAICPELGCDSEGVVKIFKKAPTIGTKRTQTIDKLSRMNAERYGLSSVVGDEDGGPKAISENDTTTRAVSPSEMGGYFPLVRPDHTGRRPVGTLTEMQHTLPDRVPTNIVARGRAS